MRKVRPSGWIFPFELEDTMSKMTIVLIKRAAKFSPNNVENDKMILEEVDYGLTSKGFDVKVITEDEVDTVPAAQVYVSMGRSVEALTYLSRRQTESGCVVINSPNGVSLCCRRTAQMRLLEEHGIAVAPHEGAHGYWIKRGDGPTIVEEDVAYAADKDKVIALENAMRQRGVKDIDVRAHVMGDLVKFYGVNGTAFFRYYYPTEDGRTKFNHELVNGMPKHIPFDVSAFKQTVTHAASLLGVDIYGGDAVVQSDGTVFIIDFNDWPSFSRCRGEAAQAIVQLVEQRI